LKAHCRERRLRTALSGHGTFNEKKAMNNEKKTMN